MVIPLQTAMRRVLLALLALPTAGRRYHDNRKHRHGHTYLQLCTDGDGVHPVSYTHLTLPTILRV